jgi:hypothetical protein
MATCAPVGITVGYHHRKVGQSWRLQIALWPRSREESTMELTHKERALIDRVIEKIKEFDPQAVVKIADDTLEHEDVLLVVYTDKPTLETIQHITPCTLDILGIRLRRDS